MEAQLAIKLLVATSLVAIGVSAADEATKLAEICSERSLFGSSPMVKSVAHARALLDYHSANVEANHCPAKYRNGLEALRDLLSEQVLGDVCSSETIDKVHKFHLDYIYYMSPEMSDLEIRERKSRPRKLRLQPLPEAFREFFVVFVKQINTLCVERFLAKVDQIDELAQQADPWALGELDFEPIEQLSKLNERAWSDRSRSALRGWLFSKNLKHLTYIKMDQKVRVVVPPKPKVLRVYNVCQKRFRPYLDQLLEPVVRLNNLGYLHHEALPASASKRLRGDKRVRRWLEAYQYCEVLKNVDLMAIEVPKDGGRKFGKNSMGFVSEQRFQELQPLSVPFEDTNLLAVGQLLASPVGWRDFDELARSELKRELRSHAHAVKQVLRERYSPMVAMEKTLVLALLRRFGLQPMPVGLHMSPSAAILTGIFVLCVIALISNIALLLPG